LRRYAAGREESRAGGEGAMEKGASVAHMDSGKDQLREEEGMEYERDSPYTLKGRGKASIRAEG
jgi:hypothetical protein